MWGFSSSQSSHQAARGGAHGKRKSGRHTHVQRQAQSMVERQEMEKVQRTERFLEQIEKATRNVKEYMDVIAMGADQDTMEEKNLIATMSLRAMNMSSKALRKDGLEDALRLGRKKILEFYRTNAGAFDGSQSAEDLFEQYTAYMRNVVEGKQVPRLPVAVPDATTNEEANKHLNETVGALLGGYHGVDEGDARTARNFEAVKAKHAEMIRQVRAQEAAEADEKNDGLTGVAVDANKFNQHVRGEKVVFSEEYMAQAERAMKEQRYKEVSLTATDFTYDEQGNPNLCGDGDGDVSMACAYSGGQTGPRGGAGQWRRY